MKSTKRFVAALLCLFISLVLFTACGSEAKKAMEDAVSTATELIEKGEKPLDKSTKSNLEEAIALSDEAKDDDAYTEVANKITDAAKAYEDSIKQLKQVTNPKESFIIERLKTVESAIDVESATEDTDANKLMNKEGGYTSYVAMKSSWVINDNGYYNDMSPVEAGTDGGAVVEAFKTKADAKKREEYLAAFDGAGFLSSGSHKVVGTLLIRTSTELTATQQKEMEKAVINALTRLE